MKSSFRWYGDSDPVTLDEIRQIPGMRSIVSAVYDVKPGEVWPEESIKHLVDECAEHGLIFDVVESIPVTEEIKLGRPERDRHIDNYCESIRRCAKYGIRCVTYNFMPVFDWTRTQLDKAADDGSTSLVMYWDQMKGLDPLKDDIHLPGWDTSYTQDEVRDLIRCIPTIPRIPSSACPGSSPARRIWTAIWASWTAPPTHCACAPAPWAAPRRTTSPDWSASTPP